MLRKIPDDIHVTPLGKQIYPVSSAQGLAKCANFAKIAKVTKIFVASEKNPSEIAQEYQKERDSRLRKRRS